MKCLECADVNGTKAGCQIEDPLRRVIILDRIQQRHIWYRLASELDISHSIGR
jgi:hypothetical protein